jgi:NSS family neurotransmitter:Na+ symporter
VYLIVILLLAVPALYAELLIDHTARANPVTALQQSSERYPTLGRVAGFTNVFGALIMMLSFYFIVAGWMLAHATGPVLQSIGLSQAAEFVTTQSVARKLLFTLIIVLLSASIIVVGVKRVLKNGQNA